MKRYGKRVLSFLLILCCLVQTVVFSPISALNTAEKSAGAAVHYGSFAIDGISIDYESTLRALDDGRYYLSITVLSTPIEMELNTHVRTAESGTYRISKSGWYLIELWGADGADGSDTTASGGSEGGRGGAGGHMYAEVYLEKDQVLFYTLGGDGVPAHVSGEGGGINGDGGHHGASGGDTVGGGGGYSALFLFEPGELQNKYGTRFIDAIDETDRTTRYFMIAGGGGGGGAGNGSSLLGSAAVGRADGGAGGSVVGSTTGVISGTGIVSGTFYAGENGKSSGTNLDYIGRGGTNLPGSLPKTWITGVSGTEPNDWAASAHPGMAGGAGGSGNLRGGGGGAGFNGGSGGVMTGTIIPSNVGGGGGGSSFLASELNGHSVTTTLSARAQACLQTSGNPSETGGALCLTYLEEVDSSFLDNVSMTMTFSPYFVPTEGGLYDEDGNPLLGEEYYEHDSDESAYKLTVKNVSLLTDGDKAGGKFTVGLYLKTINGFAGGNNVPIFADYATFVATAVPEEVRQIDFGANCGYVNVPLRFPITAHSYKAGEPGEKFFVRDLYTDDYATLRDSLRGDVRYDFISSIGEMTLTDPDTGAALPLYDGEGNPVAVYPQRTTRYRVTLPVTVKDVGVAPIGTPNLVTTQVTAWSTVDVMTSVSDSLGDYEVTYTKDVKDNGDGSYTISMNVQSSVGSMGEIVPDEGTNHHQSYSAGADGFEHPIAVTGYYLIRLWAGNGGTGANSLLAFITQGYGGEGGAGGYVDAWVHLERGWYIKGLIGKNGGSGSSNDGGTGGGYTYMQLLDENKQVIGMLAVAAGGGGGGGAYWTSDGKTGETPAATDSVYTGNLADYNGGKGQHGNNGSPKGGAGASHNNFLATVLTTGEKEIRLYSVTDTTAINNLLTKETAKLNLEHALGTPDSDHVSDTGGGVGIHFLMSDRDDESLGMEYDKVFSEYTVALPISPYFEVQSVLGWDNVTGSELSYDDGYGIEDDFFTLPNGTKLNNGVTIPVYVAGETSLVYFANINPTCRMETVEEGHEHQHVHISIDYTLSVTVIPAEGFFGGNDVPLYDGTVDLYHRQYHTDAETGDQTNEVKQIAVQENYVTDYVNVAVPKAEFTLTGNDVYYDGTPILRDDLFTVEGELPFDDWAVDFAAVENWKTAFVNLTNTYMQLPSVIPTPSVTTTYTVTLGIVAKASPVKATVGAPATGGHKTASATVYVGYAVYYELENLATSHLPTESGVYYVDKGQALSARLTPINEKYLPKQITVLSGDKTLTAGTDYTYNARTGEYTVYAAAMDGPITVRATGAEKSYNLYFYYMTSPDSTTPIERMETYEVGADLSGAIFNTYVPTDYEGYRFILDFGDGSSEAPTEMPNGDLWVIGLYVVREYELTIRYIDDVTGDVETYTAWLPYGEKYSVSSPVKQDRITQTPLVEGVMPAEHVTIDVHYEKASNMLTILYLKVLPDGSTVKAFDTYLAEVQRNTNYSVTSPTLKGYTPDRSVVSGRMPNKESVTVTVTYYPNTYTLSFSDPSGQTFAPVKVKYDNVYGYYSEDGTSFAYGAFPTPLRAGYVFDGWYDGNTRVSEDTVVQKTEDHTLTARWTAVSYNVTVRFVNDKGETVAEEVVQSLPFDGTYSVAVPAVYGHTADKLRVEGRVPAQHTVITVVYQRNGFVLYVKYQDAVSGRELADTVTLSLRHGESYEVISPKVDGYDNCSTEVVTGVADAPTMNTQRTVTVYYYENEPVIEVTVTWGELRFDLTERGAWDPETHTYAPDTFAPTVAGSNKVTVSNGPSSTASVSAEYSYTPLEGYEGMSAYFTAGDASDARLTQGAMLAPGEEETTFVYVKGNMPPHMAAGSFTVGSCTVILKGGEASE